MNAGSANHVCVALLGFGLTLGLACSAGQAPGTEGVSTPGTQASSSGDGTDPETSSSTSSTSGGSGTGSSSGAPATQCALEPGTYTVTYTKTAGGSTCTAPTPQQVTIGEASDAGATNQPGCTIDRDDSTCSFTMRCTFNNQGYLTKSETTFKAARTTASGTSKTTALGLDGGVTYDCSLAYTYKKN
jgi:hypothetical protein